MMSVRLMVGGTPEGIQVRNFLVEALWVDCDGRVSAIGGIPSSERKSSLNAIYNEFTVNFYFYKACQQLHRHLWVCSPPIIFVLINPKKTQKPPKQWFFNIHSFGILGMFSGGNPRE
jgi:hypothetical protein